jgi:3-oxoacyl-[acyl-carrier-protein] synthase II
VSATRGVVATGLGVAGPAGLGADALARALADPLGAGAPRPIVVDRSAGYHRPGGSRTARSATGLDLGGLLPPAAARRMSPPARLACAAAKLALAEAGLDDPALHLHTAIVVGTAFGPSSVTEALLRQILHAGPEQASPALFTESVASASASQAALLWKMRGPSLAVTQREASDLLALAEAVGQIETGRAERALVLVVDEMTPLLHAVLDRFHALARPDAAGDERARPFDRRRDGALAAEGAVALLFEPRRAAEARGARMRFAVAGHGAGFDPSAPNRDWGEGEEILARRLGLLLERTGGATGVDRIVSGAAGSRRGDRLEAHTLQLAWRGRPLPPVLAPKATLGEYGGGFLAAAALLAGGAPAGPTPGFAEPDPELGLAPHDGRPLPPPRRTLVTSLATSGAAAWALLDPA